MSCYHPMEGVAYYGELTENGKRLYHILGSWNPEGSKNVGLGVADRIKVPCGHCIGCVLDQARKWSDRMILEYLSSNGRALFVTLTYNNDHVPVATDNLGEFREYSLCKRDIQLFFKRVRKKFYNRRIRFYAAGEYGKNTFRPHYHAIIFGLGLCDFPDFEEHGINELGQKYYISNSFGDLWTDSHDGKSIGFHILSEVSYKTCSYVARYCMKKIRPDFIVQYGEPEFHIMSRRPGLGKTFYDAHPDLFESDHIFTNDGQEQKEITIPKYFYDRLKVDNPEEYDKLNLGSRHALFSDRELLKLQNTDLSYLDMLEIEEENKINKIKILFNREKV